MTSLTMEEIHEAGAKRHPHIWVLANSHAAPVLLDSPFAENKDAAIIASLIVLRVLDATQPEARTACS